MNKRHKHYDCIIAWAEGVKVQVFCEYTGEWEDTDTPFWIKEAKYRIKPVESIDSDKN